MGLIQNGEQNNEQYEAQKEERKNVFWKALIGVSSILLIAIAAYFIFQLFTANPLEGTWVNADSDMQMTIKYVRNSCWWNLKAARWWLPCITRWMSTRRR